MDIGIDVGGTFTDFVAVDADGEVRLAKVSSTPEDQSVGFMRAIREAKVDLGRVVSLVHGSTVAINALLERKGASVALVTTKGFRDVLELRRRDRPHAFGLRPTYEPLVPRHRRFEISARLDLDGQILDRPTDEDVAATYDKIVASGAEALVISLFNGHLNSPFERAIAGQLAALGFPRDRITIASEISQEIREFERTSTASISAYVQPAMARYLGNLDAALTEGGLDRTLLVSQSNGGAIDWHESARIPVNSIMSGPAAGAIACAHIAREAGFENAIACDIGGTSCDITLIVKGLPVMKPEVELDFGLPIRRPMIDVTSIAAGGGSIAELDQGGILRVGPRSAGARPGPACYGFGGTNATTTDAQMVLGRLDPSMTLGTTGELHLDRQKAEAAVAEKVAQPLGISAASGAAAILQITEQNIASAVRRLSTERGLDPRLFALVVYGGAGPLYVSSLMRRLSIPAALVPAYPGATSAVGCLLCDLRLDFVQSVNLALDADVVAKAREIWSGQVATGRLRIEKAGISIKDVSSLLSIYCCYEGQSHSLEIQVASVDLDAAALRAAFETQYAQRFGRTLDGFRVLVSGVRSIVLGVRHDRSLPRYAGTPGTGLKPREIWAEGSGWRMAEVVHRAALASGQRLQGPLVIEQADTTTWIEPGFEVEVLASGTLLVRGTAE